jgi:hypothetical protein
MTAGRDLDIEVAQIVTGQSLSECRMDPTVRGGEPQFYWGYPAGHDFAPEYSTDFLAVWPLVRALHVSVVADSRTHANPQWGAWLAEFGPADTYSAAFAPAEAACKAILKAAARGVQVPEALENFRKRRQADENDIPA